MPAVVHPNDQKDAEGMSAGWSPALAPKPPSEVVDCIFDTPTTLLRVWPTPEDMLLMWLKLAME